MNPITQIQTQLPWSSRSILKMNAPAGQVLPRPSSVGLINVGAAALQADSFESLRFSGLSRAAQKVKTIQDFASQYEPRQVGGYTVHNEFFTPYQVMPKAADLKALLGDLERKGSFTVITNPETGLVQTSDTINQDMRRQWFTDSAMVGYLQRSQAPASWQKSMITNAAALNTTEALAAVESTVANPNWYRQGGLKQGVFHIYLPQTVKVDRHGVPIAAGIQLDSSWENQKRLESQALMLYHLVDTVQAGMKRQPYGFKSNLLGSKGGDYVTQAIAQMGRYLLATNTDPATQQYNFNTPSASSWEEAPFKEGMTWDGAVSVLAVEKLRDLLYAKAEKTPQLKAWRQAILQQAPELTDERLKGFIQSGRQWVDQRISQPLRQDLDPVQTPQRPYDTSLMLLAASPYTFYRNAPLSDARARFELVRKTKQALMGEHGMRRYNEFTLEGTEFHDSYLNVGFHFPDKERRKALGIQQGSGKEYGSTDASSLDALQDRQALSKPEYAAQWGLGLSASLQALARAKRDVLTHIETTGKASPEAKHLLKGINEELLDSLNRNIAAIPGPLKAGQTIIRSDGTPLKPYQPIEAYEAVPTKKNGVKWIPGAHTLPWHAAQLYDGLNQLVETERLAARLKPILTA